MRAVLAPDARSVPSRATSSSSRRCATRSATAVRYLIGDVRDRARLRVATRGVDIVVHAAALKQVPACEYNPFEAVRTNVLGAQNVVDAAIDADVPRVVALRTDKAVNPVNLYGATQAVRREDLRARPTRTPRGTRTRFACVRYGNVVGCRGSGGPGLPAAGARRARSRSPTSA